MPSTEELISKYQAFDDQELLEVYLSLGEYSPEANEAFMAVVDEKGGIDELHLRISAQEEKEAEGAKLVRAVEALFNQDKDAAEIKTLVIAPLHTVEEITRTIAQTITDLQAEKADRKIKPRTVIGSVLGGFIGGTIGGVVWGIQMIYSGYVMFILGIGLVLLSYAFIRLFTKQSQKNAFVVLMTMISTGYALALGQLLFEIVGYQGY